MPYNPYAPPSRAAEGQAPATILGAQEFVLAEHGQRILAKLVDALVIATAIAPGGIAVETYDPEIGGLLLITLPPLAWILQWVLISVTGQSLGKRWLGLRVITSKGARVGFLRGVFLREWVMKAGSSVLYGFPLVLDPLFAFSRTRQCLHDHLADTLVIHARTAGDPYDRAA
jgi:uncharacterized RDD family membrane protein YckC